MTDNEIIKAFEICYISDADGDLCGDCCFHDSSPCTCSKELLKHVFDLINRQKAEIERLKRSLDNMTDALVRTDDYCRDLECKGGDCNG